MSIWLGVALFAYFIGVAIEWQRYGRKIIEWDEYSNFPVIATAKLFVTIWYFIKALVWFYGLIIDEDNNHDTIETGA
jgi:hypothetical protein